MFDNKYPYTDFHELNLDWFMGEFKKLVAEWEETKGEWNTLHDYVQDYFNNLNVQTEIDNKINAMIADGTFADIVSPFVTAALPALVAGQLPDVVAAQISSVVAAQISAVVAAQLPAVAAAAAAQEVGTWLAAHIDPDTGYVIDDTLTVSNAAADAKTVGDNISDLENALSQNENALGVYGTVTFTVESGNTHSSHSDKIACHIKSGDTFYISGIKSGNTSITADVFAQKLDGTYASIGTYGFAGTRKTFTASYDIQAVGFYLNSISATQSYTVLLERDNTIIKRIDELKEEADTTKTTTNYVAGLLGMYGESKFTVTSGNSHSSNSDKVYANVLIGESFIVSVKKSTINSTYGTLYGQRSGASAVNLGDIALDGTEYNFKADYDFISFGIYINSKNFDQSYDMIIKKADNIYSLIDNKTNKYTNVKSINHRGWFQAPENTLIAYKMSKLNGFSMVECDVEYTSDGIPVLLHDATINRTARNEDGTTIEGDVYIDQITYAQALNYDFGIYKGAQFAGTKIPTLTQFVTLCRNIGLHPYIELKNTNTSQIAIESAVTVVKDCGMIDNVTWISFSETALGHVKNAYAKARLGLVCSTVTDSIITKAQALKNTDNEVFIDSEGVTTTQVNKCKTALIPMETWTIDSDVTIINLDTYISGVTSNQKVAQEILYNDSMS